MFSDLGDVLRTVFFILLLHVFVEDLGLFPQFVKLLLVLDQSVILDVGALTLVLLDRGLGLEVGVARPAWRTG